MARCKCTWGDGEDVLVMLDGTSLMLYEEPSNPKPPKGQSKYGYVSEGSLALTAHAARILGQSLIKAADEADFQEAAYALHQTY